ncbi:META domain-containing protein [Flavobacterium sp. NST-5]|uniref:META domain-containing protein n=1 Tax=Flavobacterium ichthyis TaxID=2698827 RepID=A0ABW9Z8I6_9FLAO|nr:META domain-containing protein [Flavobacterium ichthyis]NBL65183.1 META domain-containing protein [Flavobacterium ichthyis]
MKRFYISTSLVLFLMSCNEKKSAIQPDLAIDSIPKTTVVKPEKISNEPFFVAVGTEPFWTIELTADSLKYITPDQNHNFAMAYKESSKKKKDTLIFEAENDLRTLTLKVFKQNCSDGMSDKKFDYASLVSLLLKKESKPILLNGCGSYAIDKRLDGKWNVVELAGERLNAEKLKDKKLPEIEFNIVENRFAAFAGCNRIGGELESEKDSFVFKDVVATQMMCDNIKIEESLMEALQAANKIEIREKRLYLLNFEGTKAVLEKQ